MKETLNDLKIRYKDEEIPNNLAEIETKISKHFNEKEEVIRLVRTTINENDEILFKIHKNVYF